MNENAHDGSGWADEWSEWADEGSGFADEGSGWADEWSEWEYEDEDNTASEDLQDKKEDLNKEGSGQETSQDIALQKPGLTNEGSGYVQEAASDDSQNISKMEHYFKCSKNKEGSGQETSQDKDVLESGLPLEESGWVQQGANEDPQNISTIEPLKQNLLNTSQEDEIPDTQFSINKEGSGQETPQDIDVQKSGLPVEGSGWVQEGANEDPQDISIMEPLTKFLSNISKEDEIPDTQFLRNKEGSGQETSQNINVQEPGFVDEGSGSVQDEPRKGSQKKRFTKRNHPD